MSEASLPVKDWLPPTADEPYLSGRDIRCRSHLGRLPFHAHQQSAGICFRCRQLTLPSCCGGVPRMQKLRSFSAEILAVSEAFSFKPVVGQNKCSFKRFIKYSEFASLISDFRVHLASVFSLSSSYLQCRFSGTLTRTFPCNLLTSLSLSHDPSRLSGR